MIVDAAEGDHLERLGAHPERLLGAVAAGGVLGVHPEEEVHVDRGGELGRAREPAHLRIVTGEDGSLLITGTLDTMTMDTVTQ